MVYCCVPFCKSTKNATKGVSFHEFPSNKSLRQQWLEAVRYSKMPIGRPTVCSRHFKEDDYNKSAIRTTLLPFAVPSVFEDYAKHSQIKVKHESTVTEGIKVEVNIKDEPLSDVEMSYDAENNFITVKNEIEETHLEGSAVKEEFDGKMVIEGHQVFLPRYSNIDYLPEDNFSETQQITDIIYATEIKKENKDESLTLEHWNGEKQEMQIQCGVLSSTSKSESFTVESQETENKLLLCHICGKGCRRKHDLERHMRIHPEDRLHKCDTCGKSFIQRNRLICHLYSHTQDQPFKCDICYKEFRCHYGLLVHVRRHSKRDNFSLHTERPQVPYMGEKPFKCEMWQTL